ncbi:DUF1376 domain-containing protein [Pseudomonas sp. GX19020]|uniref:DUF1376 domain-containing protein n=1 Tax=Pseudomonas sp. GX19020 TaxID=2942277 RepID=UPI002019D1F5|nr:DUF1376 domain-containing protein [Pseudomonas sp. GX19020]MCL4065096.1 DUF1376 domain-containing protein [Pseudomonas sp. GX19020]
MSAIGTFPAISHIRVYLLLLITMWRHDARLPNSPTKLARIARVHPPRWSRVWAEIEKFFIVTEDGFITNSRLLKEHEKARHKSQSRAASGAKGGRAKALKSLNTGVANATDLPEHCQRSEPEEDKSSSSARVSRFEEFWQAYPHRNGAKKGRAAAEAKYATAVKSGIDEAVLIDAARRYGFDRQVAEGFAKDPATWLHQKCWWDEVEVAKPQAVKHAEIGEIRMIGGKRKKFAGVGAGWLVIHD